MAILLTPFTVICQNNYDCALFKKVYYEEIQKSYNQTYISDSLVFFNPGLEDHFMSYFQKKVPQSVLKKVFTLRSTKFSSKLECSSNFLAYNKEQLIKKTRSVNVAIFIEDSSFAKNVDKQQTEISKITNEDERQKQLNELTKTPDFKKYTQAMDFFTPRVIEFSLPIIIEEYCFLRTNILKNYTDDKYSIIYVYKRGKNTWTLVDKWQTVD